jgi:arylamine N-acetyltransferase
MKYLYPQLDRYLEILNIPKHKPSLNTLTHLVKAHLIRIPFENISKIYYKIKHNLNYIPDLELYLDGIVNFNFGGTCYSNNYYLNRLLNFLGYDVQLCGADMNNPDVHMVNIVSIDKRKYLIDVGYAAPFYYPIPIDFDDEIEIRFGSDKYVFQRQIDEDRINLRLYRNNIEKHGYAVKQKAKSISDFEYVIKESFRESATFLNALLLVKYYSNLSIMIHNYSFVESKPASFNLVKIHNKSELIDNIVHYFKIPNEIVTESVNFVSAFSDAWN